MVMVCPYCDMEISESGIEAEGGCCPECGAIVTASSVLMDPKELKDADSDNEVVLDEYFDEDFWTA